MAKANEISEALAALAVHCRPAAMSPDERAMWVAGWVEDLRDYPIEAILTACRRWRLGQDRRFPTPGQLEPLVRDAVKPQARADAVSYEPWRPLTQSEFDGLTLREKARHLRIEAMEQRKAAGPQTREPSEMPDIWFRRREQADSLEAEAARLEQIARTAARNVAESASA